MTKTSVTTGVILAAVFLAVLYAAAYLFPRPHMPANVQRIPMSAITPKFMGEVAFGRWRLICGMVGEKDGAGPGDEAPTAPAPSAESAPPPAAEAPDATPTVIAEPIPSTAGGTELPPAPVITSPPPIATATPPAATPTAPAAANEPRRICRLNYMIVSSGEKPRVMAGINILSQKSGADRQAVLILRLPPQIKGGDGVIIWVDDKEKSKLPLGACTEKECLAQSGIPDKLLQEMLGGKALSLALPAPENKRLKLDAALPGFKPAWEALGRAL